MSKKPVPWSERHRALPAPIRFVIAAALPLLAFAAAGFLPGAVSAIHLQLLLLATALLSALFLGLAAGLVGATLGFGLMLWRAVGDDGTLGFQAALDAFLWFAVAKLAVALVATRRDLVARLSEARDLAEAEARRRKLLHAELLHRVSNDLSLQVSMLQMQAAAEPDAADALQAAAGRVHVLGRVHGRLSRGADAEAVMESRTFLEGLVADLRAGLDGVRPVALTVTAESHPLPLATAGDVGLVVNELITNALKHAFPAGREGVVRVTFRRDGDAYELVVADNGVGAAPGRAARGTEGGGLGGQLVRALATQLGGRLEVAAGEVGGTACTLRFPVPPRVGDRVAGGSAATREPLPQGPVATEAARLRGGLNAVKRS